MTSINQGIFAFDELMTPNLWPKGQLGRAVEVGMTTSHCAYFCVREKKTIYSFRPSCSMQRQLYKSSLQFNFRPRLPTKVMGLGCLWKCFCFLWCAFHLQKHIHCPSHKFKKSFDITNFLHGARQKSCHASFQLLFPLFFAIFFISA